MTREEELVRIAKKLDKMVSRNNTVRLYFDTHRWRVVLRTRPWPAGGFPSRLCGKAPLDFCPKKPSRLPAAPVRRSRPRRDERSTGVRVGIRTAGHASRRACRPLVDSVAPGAAAARTTERRDEKVNSAACCGRSRRCMAAQKKPNRARPRSEIRRLQRYRAAATVPRVPLRSCSRTSWSLLDKSVTLVVLCGQDGAMELLRELKSFSMTLRLLQVGPI